MGVVRFSVGETARNVCSLSISFAANIEYTSYMFMGCLKRCQTRSNLNIELTTPILVTIQSENMTTTFLNSHCPSQPLLQGRFVLTTPTVPPPPVLSIIFNTRTQSSYLSILGSVIKKFSPPSLPYSSSFKNYKNKELETSKHTFFRVLYFFNVLRRDSKIIIIFPDCGLEFWNQGCNN